MPRMDSTIQQIYVMFLLSIRVTIVVYIIILKIFFFSYTFNEKSDSSSTIPTEPEVLNKPRCLDLREFITEPTCITEMKAPDQDLLQVQAVPFPWNRQGTKSGFFSRIYFGSTQDLI